MLTFLLGEWLNGRVAVSKTVGCVFESRLPCQIVYCGCDTRFFYIELLFVSVRAFSHAKVASDAIRPFGQESLFRRFAPYESQSPLPVYCAPGGIFRDQQKLNNNGSYALISLFFRRSPQTRPPYGKIRVATPIPRPEDSTTARYKRLFRLRGAIKADYGIL